MGQNFKSYTCNIPSHSRATRLTAADDTPRCPSYPTLCGRHASSHPRATRLVTATGDTPRCHHRPSSIPPRSAAPRCSSACTRASCPPPCVAPPGPAGAGPRRAAWPVAAGAGCPTRPAPMGRSVPIRRRFVPRVHKRLRSPFRAALQSSTHTFAGLTTTRKKQLKIIY